MLWMRPVEMELWRTQRRPPRVLRSVWRSRVAMLRDVAMIILPVVPLPALAQDNVVAVATLPRDLSPWGMYLNADPVVKACLIGLAFASSVVMSVRLDHGEDTLDEMHEINVTPFIEVMLVLLIIFMVAAPLATVDILVNLPASTADARPRPDRPLYLTVKSDLTLALGDDSVSRDFLPGTLDAAGKGDKDTRICVRTRRYLIAS